MFASTTFAEEIETLATSEPIAQSENLTAASEPTAKKWTNNAGVGLTVPFNKYDADGDTIDQTSIAANLMYLGMHQNGFTVKAAANTGVALTNSIAFAGDDDLHAGTFVSMELGAGWSFVRSEKFTLSALAMLGFEGAAYNTESKSYSHAELGNVDRSFTATVAAFTVGADITATLYTRSHFGVFCSVAARYMPISTLVSSVSYKKDDFARTETYTKTGHGAFSVTPAVGAVWRW